MPSDDVIVIPGEPPRSAEIVSTEPLVVRWEDTGEEEALGTWPRGSRRVVRDTLAHRVLVDPAGVRRDLDSSTAAIDVVLQLLRDSDRSLSAVAIKERLTDPKGSYCLPKDLVDKGLRGLPGRLRADPSVQVTEVTKRGKGDKTSTVLEFSWAGPVQSAEPTSGSGSLEASGELSGDAIPAATAELASAAQPAPSEGDSLGVGTPPPESGPGSVVAGGQAIEEEDKVSVGPDGDRSDDVLGFLAGSALPAGLDLEQVPLASAASRLAGLDDRALAKLRSQLEDEERFDVAAILFATERSSKPVAALARDWPMGRDAELVRALRWLSASGPALSRALELLSHRRGQPSEQLVEYVVTQLARMDAGSRALLLRILGEAPPQVLVSVLERADVRSLLRLVNREPLPVRSRLLWAAARVDPDSVRSPDAWGRGVTVDDLVILSGRSPEDALLVDPWVSTEIAGPLVVAAVRGMSTRRELARVLAWPSQLLSLVPTQHLATMVRRCAEQDTILRDVVEALSGRPELDRLRGRIGELERVAEQAHQEAVTAREAEAEARAAEERSFRRAAAAERDQVAASQAELRQAHLDGIKALVSVLALGSRLDGAMSFSDGLERLEVEATRVGVSVMGVRGNTERFDPNRHELLGGHSAEMVEVREPGFAVDEPGGPVILRRAVVVAVDAD